MCKISMSDIRMRSLNNKRYKQTPNFNVSSLYEQTVKNPTINLIERLYENFDSLSSNQQIAFNEAMEVFKEFWQATDNLSQIKKASNLLCNIIPTLEADNPVHDLIVKQSRDARNVFKRQVKRNTNYLNDLTDRNTGSYQTKDLNNQEKKTVNGIDDMPEDTDTSKYINAPTKESVIMNCYSEMENIAYKTKVCDRVLYNHNKLSKRFNIDRIIRESKDTENCIYELCRLIDTYDSLPFTTKYNIALESISYALYKNTIHYEMKDVVKSITEYFLFKEELSDDNKQKMLDILEKSMIVDNADLSEIDYMVDSDQAEDTYFSYLNTDSTIWMKESFNEGAINDLSSVLITSIINTYNQFKSFMGHNKKPKKNNYNRSVKELFDECVELNGDQNKMLVQNGYKAVNSNEKEFIEAAVGFGKVLKQRKPSAKCSTVNFTDDNNHKYVLLHIQDVAGSYQLSIIAKQHNDNNFAYIIPVWSRDAFMNIIECKTRSNPDYVSEAALSTESIKDMINSFKKENNKSIDKMKTILSKIYTKSPDNIIEETPNFLSWIRTTIMLSTFAINPVIGILVNFTDQLIALDLKREQTKKVIAKYESELAIANKKLSAANTDEDKDKYKKYIESLESSLAKINEYYDTLKTDKELYGDDSIDIAECSLFESVINMPTIEEYIIGCHEGVIQQYKDILVRMKNIVIKKVKSGIANFIQVLKENDQEVINFENITPNTIGNYLGYEDNKISMYFAKCLPLEYKPDLTSDDMNNIFKELDIICDDINKNSGDAFKISYDGTEDLIYLYMTYDEPLYVENDSTIKESLHIMNKEPINTILSIAESVNKVQLGKNSIISLLNENILKFSLDDLDSITELSLIDENLLNPNELISIFKEYKKYAYENILGNEKYIVAECLQSNIYKLKSNNRYNKNMHSLNNIIEECNCIDAIYDICSESVVYEGSATNTLKIASEKLKKSIINLSDKEKEASKTLDASLSNVNRNVEKALTNDNREAIIKGQVIPSASKCIKLAIAGGALYAVNPALAVISALAMLGVSKAASRKERQLILDEINIELEICDKRIQMAEQNNDMKALSNLLRIQKKLERERQRLRYRMKVYYKDDAPDSSSGNDR